MIFWREVQYTIDAAIRLLAQEQHISKRNYEISVAQEIHISRLELQMRSLELFISFLKYIFGIWNWGLANSFRDYVIQIPIIQVILVYKYEQLKSFVETFTLYSKILIFKEKLCKSTWIFTFDTDHAAQINSAH